MGDHVRLINPQLSHKKLAGAFSNDIAPDSVGIYMGSNTDLTIYLNNKHITEPLVGFYTTSPLVKYPKVPSITYCADSRYG